MMKGDMLHMVSRIFVFCLLFMVFGCTDEPAPVTFKPVAKKIRTKNPSPVINEEKEKKELFVYNPIGKRDPFESLLQKELAARESSVPRTPLEKFELGQFRIQAILIGKGAPRAMVSAPDGKNYILKPGLKIGKNSGVIININKTEIIVEESTADLAGNLTRGLQSLSIPERKSF